MTCRSPKACQRNPNSAYELCRPCAVSRGKRLHTHGVDPSAKYLSQIPEERHEEFTRLVWTYDYSRAEALRIIQEDIAVQERRKARAA